MPARSDRRTLTPRVPRGWGRTGVLMLTLGAVAAVAVAAAPPDARPVVVRLAAVGLAVVGAVQLLRRAATATRSTPEQFEDALRLESASASVIPGLRAIDQTVRMAAASGFGAAMMLRPLLLDLAKWRLLRNRRVDLETAPERAREALGEPLWRLLQERDVAAAWSEPGIELRDLQAAVTQLERV